MSHQLFLADLRLQIKGEVLSDAASLGLYSTDASVYQIKPVCIVLPRDREDVHRAITVAKDHQICILPRGGGTSLAGQTVGHAMILDFSKYMNQVLEFNEEEKWIRVQPGLVRDELNAFLQPYGLHFAPDPATSSRANVGGMIGNNSSGTKSILYGKTVDHVLELEVILADGTQLSLNEIDANTLLEKCALPTREGDIYRKVKDIVTQQSSQIESRFPKVMRRVQGYNLDELAGKEHWNLSKIICGSEGTLATFVEAKIRLTPLPKHKAVCVVHFQELLHAIEAVTPMLAFQPAAIEILDDTVVRLSRQNLTTKHHAHFIEGDPAAIQIVEFYGDDEQQIAANIVAMIAQLKALGLGYAYPYFPEGPNYEDVWVIRKKGLGLMLGLKGNKKPLPFIEDACVPTDVLPEYIDRVLKLCKKHGTDAAMYAHASVGVIHVRPILDLRLAEDIERFKNIADETFQLVMEYGGSWSGEHGDGLVRSYYLKDYFGAELYEALRQIKKVFDPDNRMNPGKIVDAPPIDQDLRYGEKYRDLPLTTHFHYREDGGFTEAVHMCTGVGECRKMLGGTMCPSFKATREEEHSTRGRANALRLAMSGQLNGDGLADNRIKEVMDLCLSCKACKSECPSNVDMARLKSEVLQMHYDQHGVILRDRLIGESPMLARRMSGWKAGLVNGMAATRLARKTLQSVAAFDERRTLPAFAKETFVQWYRKHFQQGAATNGPVVLFVDTYLNYHEPSIGKAACRLLTQLGYEVLLADVGCCQRPRISHGFLRKAKQEGANTLRGLKPFLDKGLPVVVCEPSCASALADDLPDLIDDESFARQLKENVQPLELYLAKAVKEGAIKAPEYSKVPEDASVLLHGHCHQKALFGTAALKTIFSFLTGVKVEEIPSGCCGMAGSFGYEKEHYDISKKIGEQVLFPAIRMAEGHTPIIANGFSCRHQIADFTDRRAKHWVEVACELLR
ncbi:MAG: FAD-linked oxidase C-terminal domain-containing protein [Bacteroidota bacterium]